MSIKLHTEELSVDDGDLNYKYYKIHSNKPLCPEDDDVAGYVTSGVCGDILIDRYTAIFKIKETDYFQPRSIIIDVMNSIRQIHENRDKFHANAISHNNQIMAVLESLNHIDGVVSGQLH